MMPFSLPVMFWPQSTEEKVPFSKRAYRAAPLQVPRWRNMRQLTRNSIDIVTSEIGERRQKVVAGRETSRGAYFVRTKQNFHCMHADVRNDRSWRSEMQDEKCDAEAARTAAALTGRSRRTKTSKFVLAAIRVDLIDLDPVFRALVVVADCGQVRFQAEVVKHDFDLLVRLHITGADSALVSGGT